MSSFSGPRLFDFSGRRIWIFGGAGYLGRAVVQALDSLNAEVSCLDLPGKADQLLREISFSPRVNPISLDLLALGEVKQWIENEAEHQRIPHGAAFLTTPLGGSSMEELTVEELTQYNEAGLSALFAAVRQTGNLMRSGPGGSIVLFSSMYGQVAPDPGVYQPPMQPNPLQYGMQKAAINQMARYLAVAWGKENIRCNTIAPGPFPSPVVQRDHPEFIERLASKVPLGRIGQASEIAGAVAFLLSDAASFVSGHNLVVDGGWTAW